MSKTPFSSRLIASALVLILGSAVGAVEKRIEPSSSKLADHWREFLNPVDVRITKPADVMSSRTKDWIAGQTESVTLWVFFADKGPTVAGKVGELPESEFPYPHALERRKKNGVAGVVFADLPVYSVYTDRIRNLGITIESQSRWLNAVAVTVPSGSLDAITKITEMPFVVEVRRAVKAKRREFEIEESRSLERGPIQPESPQADVLNYGASTEQILQIKSHIGHQQGFYGQGVTIAMFDTGYRLTHNAFAQAMTEGRILAQYDFVNNDGNTANQFGDPASSWNHGTATWSTCGGYVDGQLYGPAFGANFLLAKTENVSSETIQEEFDWVEALEWADSLGADVVSSSLAYIDWYVYADMDGATAVTTIAANMAASLGIVVCNAMANSGPSAGTLNAPADAFDILACGAVDNNGNVASFSSRGPTFDGRIKPEVCARGVFTSCATAANDASYGQSNGTSLSTPLVAGVAAQLISARPNFPAEWIMQALMETASNAGSPNNDIGHGIINLEAALDWGVRFDINGQSSGVVVVDYPGMISVTDQSDIGASDWDWDFGDSGTGSGVSSNHTYNQTGTFDVSLELTTLFGQFSRTKENTLVVRADTLKIRPDSAYAGHTLALSIDLTNAQTLQSIVAPIDYDIAIGLTFDSAGLGSRTAAFQAPILTSVDIPNKQFTVQTSGGVATLPPGSGEVLKLYFTIEPLSLSGQFGSVAIGGGINDPLIATPEVSFEPRVTAGQVTVRSVIRGDADNSGAINIGDVTFLIARIFASGPAPLTVENGDANFDTIINIGDVTYLIGHIFGTGPSIGDGSSSASTSRRQ